MDADDPLHDTALPPVTVDVDAALDRTRDRGRRRRHRRVAALGVAAGAALAVLGVTVAAVVGGDGGEEVATGRGTDPAAAEAGDAAVWEADRGEPPEPGATTFVALVTRLGCNGGVTGDVLAPTVKVTPDEIVVTFTVAPLAPGHHTCPGNEAVRYEVDVGEEIGDRPLRDGACAPGGEAATTTFCTGDDGVTDEAGGVRWPFPETPEPRPCPAPEGSPLDVAGEPGWRPYAAYSSVTDEAGCLVRIDVIAERPGPDHCDFADARVLITGDPLGTPYTSAADSVEYVRDPDGVFEDPALVAGFRADAELPPGAEPSGYVVDGQRLWTVPDDPSAVWLITADHTVERWPRGQSPGCA